MYYLTQFIVWGVIGPKYILLRVSQRVPYVHITVRVTNKATSRNLHTTSRHAFFYAYLKEYVTYTYRFAYLIMQRHVTYLLLHVMRQKSTKSLFTPRQVYELCDWLEFLK